MYLSLYIYLYIHIYIYIHIFISRTAFQEDRLVGDCVVERGPRTGILSKEEITLYYTILYYTIRLVLYYYTIL